MANDMVLVSPALPWVVEPAAMTRRLPYAIICVPCLPTFMGGLTVHEFDTGSYISTTLSACEDEPVSPPAISNFPLKAMVPPAARGVGIWVGVDHVPVSRS